MKTWTIILVHAVVYLCTTDGKGMEKSCTSYGGKCIAKTLFPMECVKLPYICGSDEICCKSVASSGRNITRKVNGQGSMLDIKRKCLKTHSRCKSEGGMCIPAENTDCNLGVVSSLCKGASCKCCIGEKESCRSLPACKFFGGFCMSAKYSYFCGGRVDKTSCGSPKCSCCLTKGNCKCGQANENRITGGEEVSPKNKYPWMAHIYARRKTLCGGVIINDRFVLTAAHCLANNVKVKDVTVVLADHNQHSTDDDIPGVTIEVNIEYYKLHEKYDVYTANNDIALIKLKEPLDLSAHKEIQPICLPSNPKETYEGAKGTVTGWGHLEYYDISSPNNLEEVTLPIWDPQCKGYSGITKNMICAGLVKGGKDSCQGDSGGPLFVKEGSIYTLVGIVSWGIGCGNPRSPGVYTRVTRYLKWILKNTPDANYCS